jgi:hypothetical protein
MSFVPRATLIVACATVAAALATTSTAAETWPSGGASLTATIAPALHAPTHRQFSLSTGPSGGVALFPLAHIAARLASPYTDRTHRTWTVGVDGRELRFNQLSRP